jgi:hypothetical protein
LVKKVIETILFEEIRFKNFGKDQDMQYAMYA